MMKWRAVSVGAVVCVLISFWPIMSLAQEKSWHFNDWDVDLTIESDGSVRVVEHSAVEFVGSFSWITRTIPKQGRMTISDITVIDEDTGKDITNSTGIIQYGYATEITIYQASLNQVRNWSISYTADNVINNFDTYDELYWNAVSDDRDVPIDSVSVEVHLPESVKNTSKLQQRIYSGYYGSTEYDLAEQSTSFKVIDPMTMYFEGRDIAPYTNFTIVAGFPKGMVPDPPKINVITDDQPTITALADITSSVPFTLYQGINYVNETIPAGTYTVRAEQFGYEPFITSVTTPESGTVPLYITMKKTLWFTIAIALAIAGAIIYISLHR